MTFSDERLEELSAQHHMEGGGYCFDNAEGFPELEDRHGLVLWEDPDFDYLGVDRPSSPWNCTFFFEPHGYRDAEWPETITRTADDGDVYRWKLLNSGWFYDSETECGCSGGYPEDPPDVGDRAEVHLADDTAKQLYAELAGDPVEIVSIHIALAQVRLLRDAEKRVIELPLAALRLPFEFDGCSDTDRAYPYCPHCEGDGYRSVEPGCWANYESVEDEDEDEEDDDS